jgi:arylsulfatase A
MNRLPALAFLLLMGPWLIAAPSKPNIIWVMADDLGMGDLGCFGQKKIKTPNLDRMASEGTRFTSTYCGTSVCAPSRASLMTGLHMGHCPIRANREVQPEGQKPLPKENPTVAELLKKEGYNTGLFGKWGLGHPGSGSEPTKRGFDAFYGYNCQRKAHSYFPPELWRNDERVTIAENADGKRGAFSHDLITAEMLKWVRGQKDKPFYLFFAATPPHGKWEVPDPAPYANEPWNDT